MEIKFIPLPSKNPKRAPAIHNILYKTSKTNKSTCAIIKPIIMTSYVNSMT